MEYVFFLVPPGEFFFLQRSLTVCHQRTKKLKQEGLRSTHTHKKKQQQGSLMTGIKKRPEIKRGEGEEGKMKIFKGKNASS